jgi:hypothetical protein
MSNAHSPPCAPSHQLALGSPAGPRQHSVSQLENDSNQQPPG